ncbi:MAG: enoyl-CoA hydratase/isomerase family protein [Actinomycetota bacterium]|nr:enoyl-CoA hydratase/isomerase family protein [Actinomycetota bacterium]MDP9487410.1 enoyl-CoA hydratase/isomerase family protein [Actinomycetota bacterium]
MHETRELLVDRPTEGVLRLRMNRPDRLNAVNAALVDALMAAFDDTGARAVILGSSSPKAFCSGVDLEIRDEERARVSDTLYELYEKMIRLPVPIVVVVDGHAVGAGAQMAIAGDLRVLGPGTKMRVAGPRHGLAVAAWGLPGLVGRGRALDLCLTMRSVDAHEAKAIGLAERVEAEPDSTAVELASALTKLDEAAVSRVKRLVQEGPGLLDVLRHERAGNRETWTGSVAALLAQGRKERG